MVWRPSPLLTAVSVVAAALLGAEAEAEEEEEEAELPYSSFLTPNWVEYWYWPEPSTTIIRP